MHLAAPPSMPTNGARSRSPDVDEPLRASSKDVDDPARVTLSRAPQPYHRRGESLVARHGPASPSAEASSEERPSTGAPSEASESGTEADDEKGPILKSLPAPPLRVHKGLRGTSPARLTPAATPLPTPPAYVEADGFGFGAFKPPPKSSRRRVPLDDNVRDYRAYTIRRRREVVRRCVEATLLGAIGAGAWASAVRAGATVGLMSWANELAAFLLLPLSVYLLYPLRTAWRAHAAGKTVPQALRLGLHIPSRFDPGPLLYPVALPVMIAVSLFPRSAAFLPAAMVSGLSSLPSYFTATPQAPAVGGYVHWLMSILPLHAAKWRLVHDAPVPLALKMDATADVAREDLVTIFPLHQALVTTVGYLTTSSLDVSERHLLCTALVDVLLFAHTPQSEILKGMVWLGGLGVFVSCRHLLIWEVTLARIPQWKFQRARPAPGLLSRLDHTVCALFMRRKRHRTRRWSSESDDGRLLARGESKRRPGLHLRLNGRTSTTPLLAPTAVDGASVAKQVPNGVKPTATAAASDRPRRKTFTAFDDSPHEVAATATKDRPTPVTPFSAFLSFTVEQARFRKYAYAALTYLCVAAVIVGPVRLYISKRALSGAEPFGWALGYLFGDIPAFRRGVVSYGLDRWIGLPPAAGGHQQPNPTLTVASWRDGWMGAGNCRLMLCGYCGLMLLGGIATVLRLSAVVEVDTRRKVFHGIMVAMLLPTIFIDPCFLALALSLILSVFLLLDLFRAAQLPPISKPLTAFLAPYVDGRDHRGPVIVSHMFLLVGCAIPLWLSLAGAPRTGAGPWRGWDTPVRDLSMVSGVVCVGMGDAAASLVGRRYGRTKWYWAGGKSLEGSLAFTLAVAAGLFGSWVWLRVGGWVSWPPAGSAATGGTLAKCLVAGMGASLLESTLTAANDNVVVPVGLWLLVRGLGI